jgi:predicted 2-oxoglutarate/Fe(II)-dependent dioxygenase YbiX
MMHMTTSICDDLASCLSEVKVPGDYCTTGSFRFALPKLSVEGVGSIALPLSASQAKLLIKASEPAPYGRGEETLIDPSVRRTWQIDADRVRIQGQGWENMLRSIVAKAAQGLGVTVVVEAELYKLLVYDKGSFFVEHRDTEKAPGMFATLIVALPSVYEGGELVVRHQGREVHADLRKEDPSEIAYAAFYADCVHELLPITSGYRLVLVFNLLRQHRGPAPRPPCYDKQQSRIERLLRAWASSKEKSEDLTPEKLVYTLAHAYTPAELAFDTLKGPDAAQAAVLTAAAKAADCDLHLALLTVDESGPANYDGGYFGYKAYGWDEDDDEEDEDKGFEIVEVSDRYARLTHWRRPDGKPADIDEYPCLDAELSPSGGMDELPPDEQHFHEATGNEGASFERTYRRAALVLWPRSRRIAVLAQAGPGLSLPTLDRWLAQCEREKQPADGATWQQARELVQYVVAHWPWQQRHAQGDGRPGNVASMLALLTRLKKAEPIESFVSGMCRAGDFGRNDVAALSDTLWVLPSEKAIMLLESMVRTQAERDFGACCALLRRVSEESGRHRMVGGASALCAAAEALTHALPSGAHASIPPWRKAQVTMEVVEDLFASVGRIDAAMAMRTAQTMLEHPALFGLDAVVLPAVLRLLELPDARTSAAVQHLQRACTSHLRSRIAEPLAPFPDWTREARLRCKCKLCAVCSGFLADPERRDCQFKAVEHERAHVESMLRAAVADVDFHTNKAGRPYTLVCTKNQASYERRAKQRKRDLKNLKELERLRG